MTRTPFALALIGAVLVSPSTLLAVDTPYAGQETRAIKSLSEDRIEGLLAGRGLGYAKAAELNGYPGPAHVLELADELSLDEKQRDATQALFEVMQAEAQTLGKQLLESERALDEAFSSKAIDEASLSAQLEQIGQLDAALRNVHLKTHLKQTALLNRHQIMLYKQLRGYGGGHGGGHGGAHGQHGGHQGH